MLMFCNLRTVNKMGVKLSKNINIWIIRLKIISLSPRNDYYHLLSQTL